MCAAEGKEGASQKGGSGWGFPFQMNFGVEGVLLKCMTQWARHKDFSSRGQRDTLMRCALVCQLLRMTSDEWAENSLSRTRGYNHAGHLWIAAVRSVFLLLFFFNKKKYLDLNVKTDRTSKASEMALVGMQHPRTSCGQRASSRQQFWKLRKLQI